MLYPGQLDRLVELLMERDAALTLEDASYVAAGIGDTPLILDGVMTVRTPGMDAPYDVPETLIREWLQRRRK